MGAMGGYLGGFEGVTHEVQTGEDAVRGNKKTGSWVCGDKKIRIASLGWDGGWR